MILRVVLLLLCHLIFLNLPAQNNKSDSPSSSSFSEVLFTVNKKPVTNDEFIYLYRKNHQNKTKDYTTEKIEEYLNLYINFKLKVEEARQRGMDTTSAFLQEFNQYKDELRKPYLPGNGLTDSLVQLTYNRMKEEIRAAHIMVALKPDATPDDTLKAFNKIIQIRNRIVSGEDFSKTAAELSEDPSAKANQGDLGYFTAMQMVYPFENAAYTTAVGDISKPVRTRYGMHILKVLDRRPSRGEIEVAHILLRTGEDKNNAEVKNKIFSIYDQLQAGVKWEDLCHEHSEDVSTKENGGKLRPFSTGMMSSIPEFERVAFELQEPGQFSDPFETQYGWHIVRLERKIPLAPIQELAPALKNKISRDERTQVSKEALQQKLKKDLGFIENIPVKNKVISLADSSLQKGKWSKIADPATSGTELFRFGAKTFKVSDFISYVKRKQKPNNLAPSRYLEQLYSSFVDDNMIAIQEENIIAKNPEYKYLLNEYYEGILLFEIMEKEVWTRASDDSVGQHQYYLKNAGKYKAGNRVKATLYSAPNAGVLETLRALLNQKDDAKTSEHVAKNKIRTESGYYTKEDKAVLQQVPWSVGMHPAQNNDLYYLAWIKEVLTEGVMSFEEARPQVISDYQNFLEANWITQLKKKYPVKMNKKAKSAILQQLQKG